MTEQLEAVAAPSRRRPLAVALLAALWVVAHGCHGDGEDHELSVPVRVERDSSGRE